MDDPFNFGPFDPVNIDASAFYGPPGFQDNPVYDEYGLTGPGTNQYGVGEDPVDFTDSQGHAGSSAGQFPMNPPPAATGNILYSEHVDQSFGAISAIGSMPSISNFSTYGNPPAANTADVFGSNPMPNAYGNAPAVNTVDLFGPNPMPNVDTATTTTTTTTTTTRPPTKKKRATTKRTVTAAELDEEEEGIPEGDPSDTSTLAYWHKKDSATGGKFIDTFVRFLHRHVIKTGSITFQLDVPDPRLTEMLEQARTEYLQPGRPAPIQFLVNYNFARFATSHAGRLRSNDNQKSARALYRQSEPDRFNYGMFNSKDVILSPWMVYFNILRNVQLRHRASFLNVEENGAVKFFMAKPFHNAVLAIAFGWRGSKDVQNPIAKNWPGSEDALVVEFLAYTGTSLYHNLLQNQDGIIRTFPMEQEPYEPVFNALLVKAREMILLPEYQQLLRDLFKAGSAYSLPLKTTSAAAFRPLDFP